MVHDLDFNETEVKSLFDNQKIHYFQNHSLAEYTSFRVGGKAQFLIPISSWSQFKRIQRIIIEKNFPFFVIGGGSNLLISDKGISGIVLSLNTPEKIIIKYQMNQFLHAIGFASSRTAWFAKKICRMGFRNLEFMTTIPGKLGGALIQNAGCYNMEMKDVIHKIHTAEKGKLKTYLPEEADFEYRNSFFKKNPEIWVYAMEFKLPKGNIEEIKAKVDQYQKHRLSSQPKKRKSAGSVFKNPDSAISDLKAWQLIEKVGLKGKTIGRASWSKEHSNFIVNDSDTKASDIYKLIRLAEEEVAEKMNIRLEREIILVGHFDD